MKFFLDIDGVMVHGNPHKCVEMEADGFYKFSAISVEILKSLIYKTKDELILSTTHRFRFDIKQWKEIFKNRGLFAKNVSIVNLPLDNKWTRKMEIQYWIDEHNLLPEDLVIIDDDKSLNDLPDGLKKRLVLTNSYIGLNNAADLSKVLNRRPIKKI
jgi:hypothetical protein